MVCWVVGFWRNCSWIQLQSVSTWFPLIQNLDKLSRSYTFIQKSIWNFLKRYDENFSKNPYPYFWISYPKFESREKSSIKWLKDNIIYIYEGKVVTSIKYFINTFPLSFQIWRISYEFSKQNQTNNIFTNYSLLTSSRFQHNNGSRHQNDWNSCKF